MSLDEKKHDVARLRDVAQALRRISARLDSLNDSGVRKMLQTDIAIFCQQIEDVAERNVEEVRQAIYARTGDKVDGPNISGRYQGGTSNTGGLKL